MSFHSWLMYLVLVLAATSTPGPAVLFIVTNSTVHGWKKAVFAALGNIAGLFILGLVAVTGLGAVLQTSEILFGIIKYAGAVYLFYLGIKLILQKHTDLGSVKEQMVPKSISSRKMFFQALGVALSNPKAIVFLTALFPQFIDIDNALVPQFSMLISTLMAFSFMFLMSYALLAHNAKALMISSKRMKSVNRISGSIFIGFGIILAASSNK